MSGQLKKAMLLRRKQAEVKHETWNTTRRLTRHDLYNLQELPLDSDSVQHIMMYLDLEVILYSSLQHCSLAMFNRYRSTSTSYHHNGSVLWLHPSVDAECHCTSSPGTVKSILKETPSRLGLCNPPLWQIVEQDHRVELCCFSI